MGRFIGQGQFRYVPTAAGTVQDITSNTTLTFNSVNYVNTTSGAVTLTLPSNPSAGNFVDIFDVAGTFDSNLCIVNPSGDGSTVGGFNDNLTINLARALIRLQYSAGRNDWVVAQIT
jgi:hypothetical protein